MIEWVTDVSIKDAKSATKHHANARSESEPGSFGEWLCQEGLF